VSSGSAPYLGTTYTSTLILTTPVSGSTYASITIGTAGIYLFTFGITQSYTGVQGITNYVNITGTGVLTNNFGAIAMISGSGGQMDFNGSHVVNCTASTYTLILTTTSACSGPPGAGFFNATRIG